MTSPSQERAAVHIGLLQCDDVQEQLQGEFGNYPEMFATLFAATEPAPRISVFRCHEGELPQSTDQCDAYITSGSRYGVNDGDDWIDALGEFVLQLHREQRKYVGICFGHQLLAKVLGGTIERSDKGWGVGVTFNQISATQTWMQPDGEHLDLVASHQDQVTQAPSEAQLLGGSQFCPNYLLQYGDHALTIQGHPEFSRDYSAALTDSRRDRIPANRVREALNSLQAPVDDRRMALWILNFIRQD